MAALLKWLFARPPTPTPGTFALFSRLAPELQLEVWEQCFSGTHIHVLHSPSGTGDMHTALDVDTGEPADFEVKFRPAWASIVPNRIFLKHFERVELTYRNRASRSAPPFRQRFIACWRRDLICIVECGSPRLFLEVCLNHWVVSVRRLALFINCRLGGLEWDPGLLRFCLQDTRTGRKNLLRDLGERKLEELMLVAIIGVAPGDTTMVQWLSTVERDDFGFVDLEKARRALGERETRMIARHCEQVQSILVEELLRDQTARLPKIRWVLDV